MSEPVGGAILKSPASIFGERVFYANAGHRHWIRDGRWFEQNGFVWPDSVREVPPEILLSFLPGGPAPLNWTEDEFASPPDAAGSSELREIAASRLSGAGLEIGAGASPFPVPLHCRVLYGDRLSAGALESELYPGQVREELVVPNLETDFDTLHGVPSDAFDFIVACHVIEHTRNPIGALVKAFDRLRAGGQLVLVVPDMTRTFDRDRRVTPLDHLIDDFERPDRERDMEHYEEFFRVAFPTPDHKRPDRVRKAFADGYAIHYHAWTYESFTEMIAWVRRLAPFRNVWLQPARSDQASDIEFYCVLTK